MNRRALCLIAVVLLAACIQSGEGRTTLMVFAASSLKPAFDKIGQWLENVDVTFTYAGTQTLTSQLQQGAPADVFASADTAHMATIDQWAPGGAAKGLLFEPSEIFAHNRLEIAVARGNPKGIHTLADLARSGLVVVLADPSVPAGKYAQQALAKAKVTVHPASLEQQVTGVLTKVALGEADAGVVYVSDVVSSGQVDGVPIPDEQNVIADYPVGILQAGQNKAGAIHFINLLLAPEGQAILKAAGFEGV